MDIYDSEKEQVEALKRWWTENGRLVIVGLVVGLGGTFGWNGWQNWRTTQAENASIAYQTLLAAAATSSYEEADQRGMSIINDYPDSGYAPLAALVLAKGALARDRAEDATRHLQWVLEHSTEEELKQVARFRLAQLAADRDDFDGALAMLREVTLPGLLAEVEELRGDVAVARGDHDAARTAYEAALAAGTVPDETRARIGIKLDDLGRFNLSPKPVS